MVVLSGNDCWLRFKMFIARSAETALAGVAPEIGAIAPELSKFNIVDMGPGEGESLNSLDELFEVLEDWEYRLKHADIDFEELGL